MTEDQGLLNELSHQAERLNAMADAARDRITKMESVLKDVGVGVDATIKTDYGLLGYTRLGEGWRICLAKTAGSQWQPLANSSRVSRIKLVDRLDDLLRELLKRSKDLADELES